MVNRNRSWRWVSAVLALVLLLAVLPGGAAAAPRSFSAAEKVRIERAIQFLKDMGDKDWAANAQLWLDEAKLKADDGLSDNAVTDRSGSIVIRGNLLGALTDAELADPVKAFEKDAWLARLLVHEKTHAHQAPEGGAMTDRPDRTADDWDASGTAFAKCTGPEATEVEAYYKLILALLRWCKVAQETPAPQGLCECELCAQETLRVKNEAQRVKDGKIKWLLAQIKYWLARLKELNYEKAAAGESLRDKVEALEAALAGTKTEHEIKLAKIMAVEKAIEDLFGKGGAYPRARDAYKKLRGEKAAAADVGPNGATVTFPGGWGSAVLPVVAGHGTVTLTVHRFALPPDPLPGFEYLSDVYDITVTGLEGELPAITLTFSGLSLVDCPQAKVYYFSPLKGDRDAGQPAPPLWASLDTVDVSDAKVKALQAKSRYGTMHAVMAPIGSRVRKTVRMSIGSRGYTSDGVEKESDLAPFIENSRTFVPVRFLAEEFGAVADWFPKNAPVDTVTLTTPNRTITIRIGSLELTVERAGQTTRVTSDVAAQVRNGRTVLPFRVIAEAFGAKVDYGPKGAPTTWVSFGTGDVTAPLDSAKDILSFSIGAAVGVIGTNTVAITVPHGTGLTALAPTVIVSPGATVSPAGGVAVNFSSPPVTYTVTAKDATTKTYAVTVTASAATLDLIGPQLRTVTLGNGGTVGAMDVGDTITLVFDEAMDVTTIIAGTFANGQFFNTGSVTAWGGFAMPGHITGTYGVAWGAGNTQAIITLTACVGATNAHGAFDTTSALRDVAGNGEAGTAVTPGGSW
jgi:hypothetical protein